MGNSGSHEESSRESEFITKVILLVVFVPLGIAILLFILYIVQRRYRSDKARERSDNVWIKSRQEKEHVRIDREMVELQNSLARLNQPYQQPLQQPQQPHVIIVQTGPNQFQC